MRRLRLSPLLVGLSVGLLLFAVISLTVMAVSEPTGPDDQLIPILLFVIAGVIALIILVVLFIERRWNVPLRSLAQAAARIGQGDLTTPISTSALGSEVGALSITLEDMRRRLQQMTANLSRQQAESNAILTGIVEGVFTVDRERRIQYLNPQAAALLGVAPDSVIGRFCGDVLNPQDDSGLRPCDDHCPIVHARFRVGARATEHLRLADGRRRSVVITSTLPLNEPMTHHETSRSETATHQIQVMRDETEEEATRRLRDAVLANISHEFKTPLSAQLASIELLLDQLPDLTTEQIADLVVSLQRGTLRLTQLIDNLLESVRIEAGRFAIRRRPFAIDDVIEQSLEMTRPLFDQRQQEVIVELPHPLPIIWGDATRLTQVFVNLLANANKFSLPGSVVRIGGRVELETITLWVEDQGPGFQPDTDFIFAPFARSTTEEPEAKGIGLGLWIVKSVVEGHGGRVTALSTENGSRISIQLPKETMDENSSR